MLHEVQSGILSLDDRVDFENPYQPVLAVHPFYVLYADDDIDGYLYHVKSESPRPPHYQTRKAEYIFQFMRFVEQHEGTLIIVEGRGKLLETAQVLSRLGRRKDTYFVMTEHGMVRLIGTEDDQLFEFLQRFPSRPIGAVGGYIQNVKEGGYKGCLGHFVHEMEQREMEYELLPGLTFSASSL